MSQPSIDKENTVQIGKTKVFSHPDQNIGHGSSSVVYKGCYSLEKYNTAIKVINNKQPKTFENELHILQNLSKKENLVKTFHCLSDEKIFFIAMERSFCNLIAYIESRDTFTRSEKITMCSDIASGLNYLHGHNILHRNIKPEAILIFEDSQNSPIGMVAKLSEFGTRQITNIQFKTESKNIDTEIWLSQEEIRALYENETFQSITFTEIFSLGLIFYFVFSGGKHPFIRSKHYGSFQMMNIAGHKFRPIKFEFEPKDLSVEHLLLWMMQELPENRPNIDQVVGHPALWIDDKLMQFILHVGRERTPKSRLRKCIRMTNHRYNLLHDNLYNKPFNWTLIFNEYMLSSNKEVYDFSKYSVRLKKSILSMIRFFRREILGPIYDNGNPFTEFRNLFLNERPEIIIYLFCNMVGSNVSFNSTFKSMYCKNYENVDRRFLADLIGNWEES